MFFWPWHGFFFWPFFGHGIMALILLIILLWIIFHRRSPYYGDWWHHPMGGPMSPAGRSAALDILEQRYARGEIQREEYLQKKTDLMNGRPI